MTIQHDFAHADTQPSDADVETPAAAPTALADEQAAALSLDDLAVGSTRLVKVDGHRLCVARTESGVYAVDHDCPHEGYGLTQGQLDGELLTCAWHNWKFDVRTGACVVGQDAVPTHDVDVDDDGSIRVTVRRPDPEAERRRLLGSLQRGVERNYVGQIARDTARLLRVGADPVDIAAVGVVHGVSRAEWGWGHSIAALTDSLAMLELFDDEQQAVPLVQGLSFVAETERDRPAQPLPQPAAADACTRSAFLDAFEGERLEAAQAIVLGAIDAGVSSSELHDWFVGAVSAHHLSYGHGAIYVQKAFELLEMIGEQHAPAVLGHLVTTIVYGTREDTLPYFRRFGREVEAVDLADLARRMSVDDVSPSERDGRPTALRDVLLGDDRAAAATMTLAAVADGAPLDHVLDDIVDAVTERLLRHDTTVEADLDDDFNWLDITHGLTYAHAVRFHLARQRAAGRLQLDGDDDAARRSATLERRVELLRLVLFCAFQGNWTGRHEWHSLVGVPVLPAGFDDPDAMVATGSALDRLAVELQRRAFDDVHATNIHIVHAVKTSRAGALEARRTGDPRVLAAVARYFDGPRQERGVRAATHRAIEFVADRRQR